MEIRAILLILNKLIEWDDIKTIKAFLKVFNYLLDSDIDCLYYYDYDTYTDGEIKEYGKYYCYFSSLEWDLVEINNISYSIGYIKDTIYSILNKYYSNNDLNLLSDCMDLKLLSILVNKKDFKFKGLESLKGFLKSNGFNDMAIKYIVLSIEANISETDKKYFLKQVLNNEWFK